MEFATVGKQASTGYKVEFLVVRFSAAGHVLHTFSLNAGLSYNWDDFTRVRVGQDGRLYYLQTSPKWGMRVAPLPPLFHGLVPAPRSRRVNSEPYGP